MNKLPDSYNKLFPYDNVRDSQSDGMIQIKRSIEENGIVAMEGACGTGKTLTALVPYINEARNSDKRVVAATMVKQQMEAFQSEIERINKGLENPVSAITLVSISDLHPYMSRSDMSYTDIDSLRESTRNLAREYDYEMLYKSAVSSNGKYAYGQEIPTFNGIEYDPYYAKYRSEYDKDEENIREVIPINLDDFGVISAEDLRVQCSKYGVCPHSMMRLAIEEVDVVIGNYMHIFDPNTIRRISDPILDDDSLVIFDEAHNLIPRVRQFLSHQFTLSSLNKTIRELEEVEILTELSRLSKNEIESIEHCISTGQMSSTFTDVEQHHIESVKNVLSDTACIVDGTESLVDRTETTNAVLNDVGTSKDTISSYLSFLRDFKSLLDKIIDNNSEEIKDDGNIQLRNPENPERDTLSNWIRLTNNSYIIDKSDIVRDAVALTRNELTESSTVPKTSSNVVLDTIKKWDEKDNTKNYRCVEFASRNDASPYGEKAWQNNLKATFKIYNCIPKSEISETLDTFASSVLMSATLEPISVYKKTTGIHDLELDGRTVRECSYGLSFPEENRLTLGVSADKFKYSNRGSPFINLTPNESNSTRKQYRDAVLDIINSMNGNIMIVMPSYSEAEWIGSIISRNLSSDDVYIDESSSNMQTENIKQSFFNSSGAVLVTAARGTLVEGVDYIGDRLKATVVCGVPITDTQSDYKTAIQAAYDEVFPNMNGFDLAYTIPAVRKTRQAIGRVIRTNNDTGIRVLIDKRYTDGESWDSVNKYLGEKERSEMICTSPKEVKTIVKEFKHTNI